MVSTLSLRKINKCKQKQENEWIKQMWINNEKETKKERITKCKQKKKIKWTNMDKHWKRRKGWMMND